MYRHRRTLLSLIVSLVILAIALIVVRQPFTTSDQPLTYTQFRSEGGQVSFEYSASFALTGITDEQRTIGMLFRAERPDGQALISLRREDGLGVLRLTGSTVLDSLVTNVDREYPDRFPDFQRESFTTQTIATYPGAVWEFTYTGTDGSTRVRQRFYLIVVKQSTGYYLSFQAPDEQFSNLEPEIQSVLDSLEFFEPTTTTEPAPTHGHSGFLWTRGVVLWRTLGRVVHIRST